MIYTAEKVKKETKKVSDFMSWRQLIQSETLLCEKESTSSIGSKVFVIKTAGVITTIKAKPAGLELSNVC